MPKITLPLDKAHRILSPRIAYLVTTVDKNGRVNAAAFSNLTSVSVKPQRLVLSVFHAWDTLKNIRATKEFVVNVPSFSLLEKVWICGDKYAGNPIPEGVNELEVAKLTALRSNKVRPPRIAECLTHLECKVRWIKNVGDHHLILADIVDASYSQGAFNSDLIPMVQKIRPLLEVAGGFFASPGKIVLVDKKKMNLVVSKRLKALKIKVPSKLHKYVRTP